ISTGTCRKRSRSTRTVNNELSLDEGGEPRGVRLAGEARPGAWNHWLRDLSDEADSSDVGEVFHRGGRRLFNASIALIGPNWKPPKVFIGRFKRSLRFLVGAGWQGARWDLWDARTEIVWSSTSEFDPVSK